MSAAEDLKNSIRAALDCRAVAEGYGVRVRRGRGASRIAHCWRINAHRRGDRNPSLQISAEHFFCHGCGVKGDVFTMIAELEPAARSFPDTLKIAAQMAGLQASPTWRTTRRPAPRRSKPRTRRLQEPPALSPPAAALLQDIWELVKDEGLTDSARRWLESRGLAPIIARDVGCRDWGPRLREIRRLISEDEAAAMEVGLHNGSKAWWAMARPGLAIPTWMPGEPAPRSWRWRFFDPLRVRDRQIKCAASYSVAGPVLPMGLRFFDSSWWCAAADPEASMCVIAEGEPDFLSLVQVLGPPIGVVGVPNVRSYAGSDPPFGWLRHLDHVQDFVVCTHCSCGVPDNAVHAHDCAVHTLSVGLQRSLHRLGRRKVRVHIMALREDRDANDLLMDDRALEGWSAALRRMAADGNR